MDYEFNYTASNGNLPTTGSFVGNGKIGIMNSAGNDIAVDRVFISKNVNFKNGQYEPNVADLFIPFGVEIFSVDDMYQTTVTNVSQYLNMDIGISTNNYTIRSSSNLVTNSYGTIGSNASPFVADVASTVYCVRHLPYSTMQTIECVDINKDSVRFLHECWTPDNIIDVIYENNVQYIGNAPLNMFIGHGKTHEGLTMAFASCYMFDPQLDVKPMGMGNYIGTSKTNFQYNGFDISNMTASSFKVSILTTFITSDDFESPRAEAIRIATSICSPNSMAPGSTSAFIRGKHVDAWGKLWNTRVNITPKNDATQIQVGEVSLLNSCLYSAMYYIYSNVREFFNIESNTNAMPMLDVDGSLIYEADMWLIPMLLVLKPDIAKGLIEYKHSTLQLAKQLAASYGFEGAKMPFVDDIIGYKNNLYYNTSAYSHVFNTCMVSINTWNYYRASKDKDWLINKGYVVLKQIATYLVDIMSIDEDTGAVDLNNVVGLNQRISLANNTFTNNLVNLAIKYATEASFDLGYDVPYKWQEVLGNLPINNYPNSKVYTVDDASTPTTHVNILETLAMFTPGLWDNFDRSNSLQFVDIIKMNLAAYNNDVVITGDENRPYNIALQAIASGVAMSSDSSYLDSYMAFISSFLTTSVDPYWKCMKKDVKILNKRTNGLPFVNNNSLSTNAMFMSVVLQGILQMRIVGGISSTRFYYEDMKIANVNYATMPSYWNFISVTNYGTGTNKNTIDVRQNVYDMKTANANGAYIMNGDFTKFTP
jgi:trehalose/maltose hydrolase-like predicted phosphorylase